MEENTNKVGVIFRDWATKEFGDMQENEMFSLSELKQNAVKYNYFLKDITTTKFKQKLKIYFLEKDLLLKDKILKRVKGKIEEFLMFEKITYKDPSELNTVFILELDDVKAIHLDIGSLKDAIELELQNLHEDDFETYIYKVYATKMTGKEIDELPEFDGF